jgi:hypothetical protein
MDPKTTIMSLKRDRAAIIIESEPESKINAFEERYIKMLVLLSLTDYTIYS